MRKLLLLAVAGLFVTSAAQADFTGKDASAATITFKNPNTCSSVACIPIFQLTDSAGASLYGTAGTANVNILTVQGIASMTPLLATVTGTVAATQSGTWNITNVSGTVSLPTGAATSALQSTGNTALGTINTTLGSPFQAGGSIGNTTFAVTNAGTFATQSNGFTSWAGGTLGAMANYGTSPGAVLVPGVNASVTASALPTGAATSANQTNASQKTQIVDGSGNVIASTSNNLNVQCANCTGSGASAVDAATFTAGTSVFAPIGGQFTSAGATACVTGHQCLGAITASRGIFSDMNTWAETSLGVPTAYGTAPSTGNYIGVNAFVTNTNANGSATSANSSPVVIASDQAAVAVKAASGAFASGSIASGALASGSIASGAAVSGSFVAGAIVDLAHGQGTMAASVPVAIASNQSAIPVNPTPYPAGATPITASATGTTAATTATLAGTSGKTTYICGYSIRANATAATTVTNTITGVITATLSSIMWVAPAASGIGVDEQIFSPCIPASTTNTPIAVVSGAPGSGGVVSSRGWGYQL